MGVCLRAEGDGRAVLLADFSGTQMASESYITCLDLADAKPHEVRQAVGMSEAVFVVSTSDAASLGEARAQSALVRREKIPCGLLLLPVSGGLTSAEAEKRSGLPVRGVLRTAGQIARAAQRLVQN